MNHPTNQNGTLLMASCTTCSACEGAGYQAPPALFAGRFDAPVLVVGQNPGEINEKDPLHLWWAEKMSLIRQSNPTSCEALVVKNWYDWDFGLSRGGAMLGTVLGGGWLESGDFVFTNAVRCRTPKNAHPSDEMIVNCGTWTRQLLQNRRAVLMMGNVARFQVLGPDAAKLDLEVPRKHPKLGVILYVHHYSTWAVGDAARIRTIWNHVAETISLGKTP